MHFSEGLRVLFEKCVDLACFKRVLLLSLASFNELGWTPVSRLSTEVLDESPRYTEARNHVNHQLKRSSHGVLTQLPRSLEEFCSQGALGRKRGYFFVEFAGTMIAYRRCVRDDSSSSRDSDVLFAYRC